MFPSLAAQLQLVAEVVLATLPCWHSALVRAVAMSGLAGGFSQRAGGVQALSGVEVEFSEGWPSHRLCGSYIIYRLRPSDVHMTDGFMSFFSWCVLQGIATPKDPRVPCHTTFQLMWWLMLLENDSPELFRRDTSTVIHTYPLSTHSP
jgi:hypothetical protein